MKCLLETYGVTLTAPNKTVFFDNKKTSFSPIAHVIKAVECQENHLWRKINTKQQNEHKM
jgi:hypothetical protein